MKKFWYLWTLVCFFTITILAQETPIRYDFSGITAEANKIILQGAGFGVYPMASVSFGEIPIDNTFDGATDGKGVIITAKPGEGVMVFGQKVISKYSALVRCSVRTDKPTASIIIATIGDEPDVFVSQNTPNNKGYFTGQYLRLQTSCTPPSTGFQPVIQVINTSKTETLTAYLDNFEVYLFEPNKYYSSAFLDGDETDPPADKISIPSEAGPGAVTVSDLSIKIGKILSDLFIEMVLIQPGVFTMGSSEFTPAHQVTITKAFYIGKYEVTQAQWQAVMGSNPSSFKGDNLPVELVSWNQCQTFIQTLNQMGQGTFRLPTEAEWEYACRAGTTTLYYWGDDPGETQIGEYAWYLGNSGSKTHDVGLKKSNGWGLYDMSGNVWEWCQDWSGNYNSEPQNDPTGADTGLYRVLRGGSWNSLPHDCRSACRGRISPDFRGVTGLRLQRSYP